jgi:hypothetical protein
MVTKASNIEGAVFYRTISCACPNCISGQFGICTNSPFVPAWEHTTIRYKQPPPKITTDFDDHEADIWNELERLRQHQHTLPWYCCLARVEKVQHPTVLLIKHLRLNARTVKCHILPPHKPLLNDFGWTMVKKPNVVCHRFGHQCDCDLLHAVNFPIRHILEVAVEKGEHKSLFSISRTEPPVQGNQLLNLPMSPKGNTCFDEYAKKRLELFNDFYLLERQLDAV